MNQNIWGPHLWFSLHTMSFVYPLKPEIKDKENYKNFFLSLESVIPCSVCKKNYMRHLKEHPIDNFLNSRKDFVYWVIDMHNLVNGEIGKKILSYDTVITKYEIVFKKKIILNNDEKDTEEEFNKNNEVIKINTSSNYNSYKIYEKYIYTLFSIFFILLLVNCVYIMYKNK